MMEAAVEAMLATVLKSTENSMLMCSPKRSMAFRGLFRQ